MPTPSARSSRRSGRRWPGHGVCWCLGLGLHAFQNGGGSIYVTPASVLGFSCVERAGQELGLGESLSL